MAGQSQTNDQVYCWEQVLRVNPLFRVSQVFAPQGQAQRLLPLYALFSALEELALSAADAEVVRRKLEWWRAESLGTTPQASRHPVMKALVAEGVTPEPVQLARLLESTESRLDADAPADLEGLERLCRQSGLPRCTLELDLAGVTVPEEEVVRAAMRSGLAQLLRESTGSGRANRFWWLPLNLLARHGISRVELERSVDSAPARAVFTDVLTQFGERWGVAGSRPRSARVDAAARHFVVHDSLQGHALGRLRHSRPSEFGDRLRRVGPMATFQAWRAARRLSRP